MKSEQASLSHIARIIGVTLSSIPGQSMATFQRSLGKEFLLEVARAANSTAIAAKQDTPFAIVLGEAGAKSSGAPVVTQSELPRYRQGGNRVVLTQTALNHESNFGVFREVMSRSYPDQAAGPLSLEKLSERICEEVLGSSARGDYQAAVKQILVSLRDLYQRSSSYYSEPWNVHWFAHVNEGLSNLSEVDISQTDAQIHGELFSCFGLPAPPPEQWEYSTQAVGKDFSEAITGWWKNKHVVRESREFLDQRNLEERTESTLSPCELDNLDLILREHFEAPTYFFRWLMNSWAEKERWVLFERDFLSPRYQGRKAKATLTQARKSLTLPSTRSSGIFMVSCSIDGDTGTSPSVEIRIPVDGDASRVDQKKTQIEVNPRPESISWSGTTASFGENELVLSGHFKFENMKNIPTNMQAEVFEVDISISGTDSLVGLIPDSLVLKCVQILEEQGRIYYYDGKQAAKVINTILATQEGTTISLEDTPSTLGLLIKDESPLVDNEKPQKHDKTGWHSLLTAMPEHVEVATTAGYVTFLRSGGQSSHQSPLIAAAFKVVLAVEPPSTMNQRSVRGSFEEMLSSKLNQDAFLKANFHFMVSEDVQFKQPSADYFPGFITDTPTFQSLRGQDGFDLNQEFLDSPEVQSFQQAFLALGISEKLAGRDTYDQAWPSKTSWRDLFDGKKAQLEGYLSSYSEMVELARREGNALEIFWASYPFSFSVWDLNRESSHCSAVMLSPLHPLRLAWLASVESALWAAEDSSQFLGTVEGWNFPFFGPGPNSTSPYFAVQSDTGDDQLFLGWSMLVATEGNSFSTPMSPKSIAGISGLGTSPTGFNASTAKSALNAFRKMTPHLPSVVIDLARQTEAPRISEVDNAVVDVMRQWAVESDYYPGGVHVLDSNKRLGQPPLDSVASLIDSAVAPRVSWRRYEAKPDQNIRSNLRLLQDPGLQILIDTGGAAHGYIDQIPLKRFSADSESVRDQNVSIISPSISDGVGWQSFSEALRAVEGSEGFPKIKAKLSKRLLTDGNADWVITGEGFIAPSTISRLLSDSGSEAKSQMLWEWQPPALDRDGSEINRRPFFSVAKIPQALITDIESLLSQIGRPMPDGLAQDILRVLGTRGVGLATLLASGGTHTLGALGFYLTFSLLEKTQNPGATRYVIPLDSAQVFLESLATGSMVTEARRRADLLEILIFGDSIQLRPIEIKFYGLGANNQASTLPDFGDPALNEAKDQAKKSLDLLEAICKNHDEAMNNAGSARSALWRNAFANLIEASAKLSPVMDSVQLGRILAGILAGSSRVKTANPLVLYFKHGAKTRQGADFAVFDPDLLQGGSDIGVAVCETGHAFEAISIEGSMFVGELSNVLRFEDEPEESGKTVHAIVGSESLDSGFDLPQLEEQRESRATVQPEAIKPESSPENANGVRFSIGKSVTDGSDVEFWPSNTGLTHMNLGVVGNLGTGKTQFIKSMISQLWTESDRVQSDPISFLIFDYKSDYSDKVFLDSVGGRSYPAHKIPINVFEIHGEVTRPVAFRKATSFISTISKIYGNIGQKQQLLLSGVIVDLFMRPIERPPTMNEVYQSYFSRVKEPDSVVGILDRFVQQEIFDDASDATVPFEEFLGRRVSVLSLSELGNDHQTKNALVTVILDLYYNQMTRTPKEPYFGEDKKLRKLSSFLLVDEANMIMKHDFEVLTDLLLQGREFGFGVILASQYLSHFKTANTDYAENLLTWMIHQVPNLSAGQLTKLGISQDASNLAPRISSLEPHKGLWHSLGFTGLIRGKPFFEINSGSTT